MFSFKEFEFLSHVVWNRKIRPLQEKKINDINNMPAHKTKKQIRSFIGMIGFYRKFIIPHFAEISAILTDPTRTNLPNKVTWIIAHQKASECLKRVLTSFPILQNPDFFSKSSFCKQMLVTGV